MVIIVAAILSFTAVTLKPFQDRNVEIEKKQNILAAINIETTVDEAEDVYAEKITDSYTINSKGEKTDGNAFTVNLKKQQAKPLNQRQLPIFEADLGDNGIKYVIPLRGSGLWGPIWGYVSLDDDFNTIYGAIFDHQGETPGLGAEITTDDFQNDFKGKTIFNKDGEFVSLIVAKAGENAPSSIKLTRFQGVQLPVKVYKTCCTTICRHTLISSNRKSKEL